MKINRKSIWIAAIFLILPLLAAIITYPDLLPHSQAYYLKKGNEAIEHGLYEAAVEKYKKCPDIAEASLNQKILEMILEGKAVEAAQQADRAIREEKTGVSRRTWATCIKKVITYTETDNIEKILPIERARLIIDDETSAATYMFPKTNPNPAAKNAANNINCSKVEDLDALYEVCAKNADGKILIVSERKKYRGDSPDVCILLDVMRRLPLRFFPSSLKEVEYVVKIRYDYEQVGYYSNGATIAIPGYYYGGAKALQENGKITVFHLPDRETIHRSDLILGDEPPETISYEFGHEPAYESGGRPDLGDALQKAIMSIIYK